MISHVTLGTNNLNLAVQFYDCVLALLNAKQLYQTQNVVFYEFPNSNTKLALTTPYDKCLARFGNGTMLALKAKDKRTVMSMYQAAISLNAACEGKPGPRNNDTFFAAYFRDLDGNKVAIFHR